MPQPPRTYCSRCGESIYNCVIDGHRVPIVIQITVGQTPDTGPAVDLGPDSAVRVPSFIREIMQTAIGRLELCVACVAKTFGLALVTAEEDPCFDANMDGIPDAKQIDPALSFVEQMQVMHARTLEAIRIGRGDPDAVVPVPNPAPIDPDVEIARLEAENAALRAQLEADAVEPEPEPEPTERQVIAQVLTPESDPATPPADESP